MMTISIQKINVTIFTNNYYIKINFVNKLPNINVNRFFINVTYF